jgi:hypothetical protein
MAACTVSGLDMDHSRQMEAWQEGLCPIRRRCVPSCEICADTTHRQSVMFCDESVPSGEQTNRE